MPGKPAPGKPDTAHCRLLRTLAEAAGCEAGPERCPPKHCLCRAQARAVLERFWVRSRPAPKPPPQPRGRPQWPAADVAKLKALWAEMPPLSLDDVATALGKSRWSVKGKAGALGLRRRDWGPGQPRPAAAPGEPSGEPSGER